MRLFVGLDLPWSLCQRLAGLAGGLASARWVPPENYHITLRFIGEVPGYRAEEVDLALSGLRGRGFELQLAGVAVVERAGRPTALRVCVPRSERLDHLQNKVETALQRIGVAPERRRFAPHVTLARVDAVAPPALAAWVQAHNLFRSDMIPIEHFTLFSSLLGKEQPVYTPEVNYALA